MTLGQRARVEPANPPTCAADAGRTGFGVAGLQVTIRSHYESTLFILGHIQHELPTIPQCLLLLQSPSCALAEHPLLC